MYAMPLCPSIITLLLIVNRYKTNFTSYSFTLLYKQGMFCWPRLTAIICVESLTIINNNFVPSTVTYHEVQVQSEVVLF